MVASRLSAAPPPKRRVILLGASNLVRSFPTVISAAHAFWGQPLDVMAAHGHGRGYGLESWVLGRALPPILDCGLWDDLASREPLETAALLTDIGNDLMFGAPASDIVGWVDQCLARLAPYSTRVIISQLPVASLETLGTWRFHLMRSLFFPRSRLTLPMALERANLLNEEIARLATEYAAALVVPAIAWYGFDPIHIRRPLQRIAWYEILSQWQRAEQSSTDVDWERSPRRLRWLRPLRRKWLGFEQHQVQPAAYLPDGSIVSLY